MKIFKNLDISDLNDEIWKVITDFPDYYMSSLGRIKSFKYNKINGKILKQIKNDKGYFFINLSKNGKKKTKKVHRLVYEAHIGKLEDGYDAHHINENREDNFIENLESKPHSSHTGDHNKDRVISEETKKKLSENHTDFRGKNNPMSGKNHSEKTRKMMIESHKLPSQKYIDIENDIKKEIYTQKEIAKKHDVCRKTIYNIKTGRKIK